MQAICGDLPPVDSVDDSKSKLKAVADSTGYDFSVLISILTTSFIKTQNEDYRKINFLMLLYFLTIAIYGVAFPIKGRLWHHYLKTIE